MDSGATPGPGARRSNPMRLSVDTTASASGSAFRNRVLPVLPASAPGGSCPGAARTLSAATAEAPHAASHQFQEDVDSFPLPPEMLKAWTDLAGAEGINGPPYVTLDAPEAELLGYPTPTSAVSATQEYKFDPDDVDALALKSLQANNAAADPPALISTVSTPDDKSPALHTPPSDLAPSCHPPLSTLDSEGALISNPVDHTLVAPATTPQGQGRGSFDQHPCGGACIASADPLEPGSASPQSLGDAASRIATPTTIDTDQPAGALSIPRAAAATIVSTSKGCLSAPLPLESASANATIQLNRGSTVHDKQAGGLSPRSGHLAEQSLEPLTPTPSRIMNTRTFPTVSQSPSPAPVQWSEDVCRSSSAPPQIGATATDSAELAAFGVPSRPKSCSGNPPANLALTPVDYVAARDSRSSQSPTTSPVSPTYDGPAHGPEYTGEPVQQLQLPAVDGLTLQPTLKGVDETMECQITGAVPPLPTPDAGSSAEQPLSPNRPQLKWWQSGPSPYQHRPLTLVNVTGSGELPKSAVTGYVAGEDHAPVAPVEDDEELSELDSASEAGASEVASTPYLSAVSTPADTPAAQQEPPSPTKPLPAHKLKNKGNARQLIDLQTYSTSILGGQTMMSAKRTRKRESSDTVCLTLNPYLTRQTASVINSPQPYLPPPPKRQKAGSAAGDKVCNQDQAATTPNGRTQKASTTKRKKKQSAPDDDPPQAAQKRQRQNVKQSGAYLSRRRWNDCSESTSSYSFPASTLEHITVALEARREFFGDGIFNNDKSVLCRAALIKAGFSRSAGAILTRRPTFECETCPRYFKTDAARWQHMDACNHFSIECDMCDETWPTMDMLREHERDDHDYWHCEECGDGFYAEWELQEHREDEHLRECQWCDMFFEFDSQLEDHEEHAHHYCHACERLFNSAHSLEQHRRSRAHLGTPIKCPFCSAGYATATGVVHHVERGSCPNARNVDRRAIFQMMKQRDPNGYVTKLLLEYDTTKYTSTKGGWNGQAWECSLCYREFGTQRALDQHLASPAQPLPLSQPLVPQGFLDPRRGREPPRERGVRIHELPPGAEHHGHPHR
ncbi:hypothetical protein A1Q1_03589 [Trichosporon asahii var. asahii CBS 2479]|uniref:C2H2-type domain-containing protein n=1 Tax=Trichosporon asahii var. asahii (strain ATCC 90039 / CBS 2479 / JCM 2466 / KCTC 7840 / NBRC 103889/ NCYC 2677 / UAMH 7654) TaxID=1186058 RepID=J5QIX1_TRIAS|nr:hypothetical protein A1Q1_03589 [Trichosporon asahii var. asahii CBS 2479]EJT47568.1 hypothetical protein A1Q1_03589 [Trichosporon asahii var. asahii CBS 2479]